MGPKLYLTTIFKLLGWALLDVIRHVLNAMYFIEHGGLPAERAPTI